MGPEPHGRPVLTQPAASSADSPAMLAPMLFLLALTNDPQLLAELAELLEEWQPEAEA